MSNENKIRTDEEAMTPQELAERLGVSRATVARWKADGCPFEETRPYTRKGYTRPRYNLAAVLEWLNKDKKGDKA